MRGASLAVMSLVLLAALPAVVWAGVGLSPATINYPQMLRGGYAERWLTVSNPGDEELIVTVSVDGSIAGWLTTEPSNFTLGPRSFRLIKATVQPPPDIPNGIYTGMVRVMGAPVLPPEFAEGAGLAIVSGVAATLSVEISDIQIIEYKVESISVPDTEECRPIIVQVGLRNTGNVRLEPRFHAEISGLVSGDVLQRYDYTAATVLPTRTASVSIRVPYQLEQFRCIPDGRYRADLVSYADGAVMDRSAVDFNIWPRGSLTVAGELVEVVAPPNVTLGELVRLEGTFKNTGQVPVLAKLTAEVSREDRLVETVAGDAVEVGIGGIEKLVAYFTPREAGRYTIRGSVLFEERRSNVHELTVDVLVPASWWLAAAALGGGLAILFVLVVRRRKRRK